MISFVMPTRDRPEQLARTLGSIGGLTIDGRAEVIVCDNASAEPTRTPPTLANGTRTRVIRLDHNAGAAARNAGVQAASPESEWVVMLDDDSHPVESAGPFADFLARLAALPPETVAVTADIHLPAHGRRESGGLPEVFVGCGVAIRRGAFIAAGGYDPSFGYYVEEYELAAKLLRAGGRIAFDPDLVIHHHKVEAGRDTDLILARLVRNNGWVMQRYAPGSCRRQMLREQRRRYRRIAEKEDALGGFARGLVEMRGTLASQQRTPLPRELWDRFTGLAHAREAVRAAWHDRPFASAAIIEPGKNCWAVEQALREVGPAGEVELATADRAEVLVIGTLSPGPMLDAADRWSGKRRRLLAPWLGARSDAARPGLRAVA